MAGVVDRPLNQKACDGQGTVERSLLPIGDASPRLYLEAKAGRRHRSTRRGPGDAKAQVRLDVLSLRDGRALQATIDLMEKLRILAVEYDHALQQS
jgi:hypothetical protein